MFYPHLNVILHEGLARSCRIYCFFIAKEILLLLERVPVRVEEGWWIKSLVYY